MAVKRDSKQQDGKVLAQNRRARYDYHLLENVEAGIELSGPEVKSAREGRVQLKDSYVELRGGQAFLVGAHISPYAHGNRENRDPDRRRRLLLHRREIDRLIGRSEGKGLTIIPLRVLLRGRWIKVEIALAQGKKQHDKRQAERRQEHEREMRDATRRPQKTFG